MPKTLKEPARNSIPPFPAKRIKQTLTDSLAKGGITAEIDTEPVPMTKLHRIWIISEQFKKMRVAERQEYVWQVVSKALGPDEQLRISMILTLTPEEYEGRN